MKPLLLAAPHRLLFLVGVLQLFGGMAWWSLALLALGGHAPEMPLAIPASLLHSPILLHLALPPFFFGFLLTVFPRWIGYPDAGPAVYAPVGTAYLAAAILLWSGLLWDIQAGLILAFCAAFAGQAWACAHMAHWLVLERQAARLPTWHGWSALAAVVMGLTCLLVTISGLLFQDGLLIRESSRATLLLYILPVFMTVGHRMIPFFAANVVERYTRWRPFWLLGAYWIASMIAIVAMLAEFNPLEAAANAGLAVLTGLTLWKWWPRGRAPGLLWVLILGFAWAPAGFALKTLSTRAGDAMDLAATHALTIGFACSLVIAMVTRVSQGHSGRPLVMPAWSWIAFAGVQGAVLLRLAATILADPTGLLAVSAIVLTASLAPWAVRGASLYVRRRADGRPG